MPSFYLRCLTFLSLLCATHAYQVKVDFTRNNYTDFFKEFNFWTANDPTHGYVDYINETSAWKNGLIRTNGSIYLGVDHSTRASGRGRKSVRVTSKATFEPGTLIVADIAHMPETCGTWPAFWAPNATPGWPQPGEIDIVEQANNAKNNIMTLHVSNKRGQCFIDRQVNMSAKPDRFTECSEELHGGCNTKDLRDNSFGSGFNENGGGVYAMEWTTQHVKIWFFPRKSVPGGAQGPLGSSPSPSTWGTPTTVFRGGNGCDLTKHIRTQRIVINTTFCGNWANGSWERSGCKASTGHSTCESFVRENPRAFRSAFWTFRSLKAYT